MISKHLRKNQQAQHPGHRQDGSGQNDPINKVFGRDVGQAGVSLGGLTKTYVRHSPESVPITVFDSAGFDSQREAQFIKDTLEFLDSHQKKGPKDQIHLAWYVVNTASARFGNFEIDLIQRLNAHGIPVIFVLSQMDRATEAEKKGMARMLKTVKEKLDRTYDIVELAASPNILNLCSANLLQ